MIKLVDAKRKMECCDDSIVTSIRKSQLEFFYLRDLAIWSQRRGNQELALRLFSAAANFATLHHPGFFYDAIIENRLLKIGRALRPSPLNLARRATHKQNSILHVVSSVSAVGGHSRTIINWIRNDPTTIHTIVTVNQRDHGQLKAFSSELEDLQVTILSLPFDEPIIKRALKLRELARSGFSACINHISQAEVIPTVAFAVDDVPPVAHVDHADHSFWLGLAVTDVVMHQRPIGQKLGGQRRRARGCFMLPIPLNPLENPSRDLSRQMLGVADDVVMGLTVGRRDKYRPTENRNFFKAMMEVSRKHEAFVLHVVGVERGAAQMWAGQSLSTTQFVFHGEKPVDPALRAAADIYLESYPFGSQTAFLEAALSGVASVRSPQGGTELLATSDCAVNELIRAPIGTTAFIANASKLIVDVEHRNKLAIDLQSSVLVAHTGASWHSRLQEFYKTLLSTNHAPQCVEESENELDHHDVALHRWHQSHQKMYGDRILRLCAKSLLNQAMERQMARSDYRLLATLAARVLCRGRADRTILQMGANSLRQSFALSRVGQPR